MSINNVSAALIGMQKLPEEALGRAYPYGILAIEPQLQ
jgi:hypothetical protein